MRTKVMLFFIGLILLSTRVAWSAPGDGLAGSAHDFVTGEEYAIATIGVCTFCHTPHRATQTKLLWNHKLSTNASFSWDATETIGGTLLPTNLKTWVGTSKLCLSCHDGSVAIGDVYWWNSTAPAAPLETDTMLMHASKVVGQNGNLAGTHPVGLPYGGATGSYNSISKGATVVDEWKTPAAAIAAGIRLFKETSGTITAAASSDTANLGIECSSCHDPHNKMPGAAVKGERLLRGAMTGSDAGYICLKCHSK